MAKLFGDPKNEVGVIPGHASNGVRMSGRGTRTISKPDEGATEMLPTGQKGKHGRKAAFSKLAISSALRNAK